MARTAEGKAAVEADVCAGLGVLLSLPCVARNTRKLVDDVLPHMSLEQRDGRDTIFLDGGILLSEEVAEYAVCRAAMHVYAASPTMHRGRSISSSAVINVLQGMGIAAGGSKRFGRLTDAVVRSLIACPSAAGGAASSFSSWALVSHVARIAHDDLERDPILRPHLVAFEQLAAKGVASAAAVATAKKEPLLSLFPSPADFDALAEGGPHRVLVLDPVSADGMLVALMTRLAQSGGGREFAKKCVRFRPSDGIVVTDYACIYSEKPAAASAAVSSASGAPSTAAASQIGVVAEAATNGRAYAGQGLGCSGRLVVEVPLGGGMVLVTLCDCDMHGDSAASAARNGNCMALHPATEAQIVADALYAPGRTWQTNAVVEIDEYNNKVSTRLSCICSCCAVPLYSMTPPPRAFPAPLLSRAHPCPADAHN